MNQVTVIQLLEANVEPLLFGAKDAAKLLGIGERTVWQLTQEGKFSAVKIGGRTLWKGEDLRSWVQQLGASDNGNP